MLRALVSILLVFCGFQTVYLQSTLTFVPTAVPDRVILSWAADPATTQSVTWRTDASVQQATAEVAPAEAGPDFPAKAQSYQATTEALKTGDYTAHYHSATFQNLRPNTLYAYRVGDGKIWSEWFHFRTAADNAAPFSFLYFGDAQNDLKSLWSRCIRQAYSTMPDIDFMVHAGDLINRFDADNEWGEWCYAGGWIFGMKPSIPTPGNHEYGRTPEGGRALSPQWRPMFTLPENGPKGLEESAYFLDYQGVRFISINSQAVYNDSLMGKVQAEWLEKMLQNNPNRWTIVTHHHPIFSTKFGRDNDILQATLQPLYEKYGVDLVLQGHDHTYGRGHSPAYSKKGGDKGPTYVVSVSGPKMYDLGLDPWIERGASNTQLYQIIHVSEKSLKYEAFTATGELYDAFTLKKKSSGANKFKDQAPASVPERLELPKAFEARMTEQEKADYRKRFEAYMQRKK